LAGSWHAEFGTVPNWIAAIGTTLAFFVTLVVLFLDRGERRRRQASQVAAWLARGETHVTLYLANSSDLLVYDVRVDVQFLGQSYPERKFPLLGPNSELEDITFPLPGNKEISNAFLGTQITFTDSAGRRWRRSRNGTLHRRFRH
jgi:hypothetical protein